MRTPLPTSRLGAAFRISCAVVGLVALVGCRSQDDVRARYELERNLWRAQLHQRQINLNMLSVSQNDLSMAIAAFDRVVSYDPLRMSADWDPAVTADIRRIRIVSKIALANLHFLNERYYRAGDFYVKALDENLAFRPSMDARLGLARSLYLAGEEDSLTAHCTAIFEDINASKEFWAGRQRLPEVFINIPVVLVRLYRESGKEERYESFSRTALDFYERIGTAWPDSMVSAAAGMARVNIHLIREEWEDALVAIEMMANHKHAANSMEQLALLRGEILAHTLDRREDGTRIFEALIARDPESFTAYAARFNLAIIKLKGTDPDEGTRILEELERDKRVPGEIASRAMYIRALHLDKQGFWDEALPVLRRISSLHPNSPAATEAPLVITRHYVASGDQALAERSLDRARDYYLDLMNRGSKYTGDRLAVGDLMIENYLTLGRAREVAELLETASSQWDDLTTAGGMFRTAIIYSEILENPEAARRVLKKCIEMFPETRYAKIARRRLELLEGRS